MFLGFLFLLIGLTHCYEGTLIPENAVSLKAPKNVIRVSNSMSSSDRIRVASLRSNLTTVAIGDEVLTFHLRADDWESQLQNVWQQELARQQSEMSSIDQELRTLVTEIKKAELVTSHLDLKLLASEVLPQRDLKILRMDRRQSEIDTLLLRDKLVLLQEKKRKREEYFKQRFHFLDYEKGYLKVQLARFQQTAPVAGRIFYPVIPQYKRVLKENDWVPSGSQTALVMTSDSMLVRFAVPETEILGFSAGTEVRVRSRDSESWLKAVVVGSDPFPLKAREWSGDALRSDAEARLFVVFARIEKANELPDGATLEVTR